MVIQSMVTLSSQLPFLGNLSKSFIVILLQNDHHDMQVQDYFTLAKLLALVIIIITGVIQLAKGLVDSRNVIKLSCKQTTSPS